MGILNCLKTINKLEEKYFKDKMDVRMGQLENDYTPSPVHMVRQVDGRTIRYLEVDSWFSDIWSPPFHAPPDIIKLRMMEEKMGWDYSIPHLIKEIFLEKREFKKLMLHLKKIEKEMG